MTDLISEEKSNKSRIRRNEEKQKAIEYASKVDLPDKNPCIDVSYLVPFVYKHGSWPGAFRWDFISLIVIHPI